MVDVRGALALCAIAVLGCSSDDRSSDDGTGTAVLPPDPSGGGAMPMNAVPGGDTATMDPPTTPVMDTMPVTGDPPPMADPMGEQAGAGGADGMMTGDGDGGDGDAAIECASEEEDLFSFFMVSYEAIRRESGSDQGFGGDLGGISGADDICLRVALTSSECAGNKQWRAFLSTTTEDAIDRIGQGPWHDRLGRLLANDIGELLNDRPINADPEIINDFPNEFGVPNHNPDGTGEVDNHQTLTGSGIDGRLYTQEDDGSGGGGPGGFGGMTACMDGPWTPEKATCWDWTVSDPVGCPRVGHSWPREVSGINWISVWNEGGCAPGVVLDDFTPPGGPTVGSFGGYGGFYCFAIQP